jgi:hypothetical protein
MDHADVFRAVMRAARDALASGELPTSGLPPGVKALAMWREERVGSVLFFAQADANLYSFDYPSLNHVGGKRSWTGRWVPLPGGGIGIHTDLDAEGPPLRNLGGGDDGHIRVTIGRAAPGVAAIRLVNDERTWTSPLGVDRFFILGTTPDKPPTDAVAIDPAGDEIPGPSIRL